MSTWASEYRSFLQQRPRDHNHAFGRGSEPKASQAIDQFANFVVDQLQTLFQSNSSPKEVSDAIAASFCRELKPEACWDEFRCAFISAAEHSNDDGVLQSLVQLILELCRRPAARNESGEDMELSTYDRFGNTPKIRPGEPIVSQHGLRYFTDAPWFTMDFREAWKGKTAQMYESEGIQRRSTNNPSRPAKLQQMGRRIGLVTNPIRESKCLSSTPNPCWHDRR